MGSSKRIPAWDGLQPRPRDYLQDPSNFTYEERAGDPPAGDPPAGGKAVGNAQGGKTGGKVGAGPQRADPKPGLAPANRRAGGNTQGAKTRKRSKRRSKRSYLKKHMFRHLFDILCSRVLLELAEIGQDRMDELCAGRTGRRPEFNAMAAQLAHLAVPYCKGSHRAAVDLLSEDIVWATLRKGQKLLRPDIDKRFRLPKRPPSREQYKRYIDEYLDDETSEKMADALQRLALEAARHCGMLNKEYEGKTSTLTDPHRTQIVGADETRVPALYRAKPDECFDPETGEKTAQCDPDAVSYADDDKQPMHPTLIATVRSDFENERIAIMAELKEYGKRDSTAVVDKILQLCDRYPHLLVGLAGVAYDMDMRAEECDRLLARKIIPIGKVQHNNRGLPASYELGELTFKRRAEKTGKNSKDESGRPGATASDATTGAEAVKLPVTVIDGVPTIPVTIVEQAQSGQDPELLECDQPLDLAKVQAKKGPSGYIVRTLYKVPGLPHIPRSLRGLSVWIRQNNTPEEIEAGMPRTRSLRIYAEGVDPRFDLYYGVRGDPESTNHHFKSSLINRRAGSVGKHRYRLDLLAYQATTIVTTLAAYHRRTKTDATHWFGQPNIDRKFKVNLKFA